jgi:hypothetical protein
MFVLEGARMSGFAQRLVMVCTLGLLSCTAIGCRSKAGFQFDRLDVLPPEEDLKEFPLGQYKIPIPIVDQKKLTRRNRLQLDFSLYALVSPKEKAQVEEAWDRREGQIRDHVISVCRSASLDELQEPELTTLKARLTDVLASQLGDKPLRQLVINEVVSQEL